jgi:hypothetical protein
LGDWQAVFLPSQERPQIQASSQAEFIDGGGCTRRHVSRWGWLLGF